MSLDDDDDQDVLARIDLHAWRVPPPAALPGLLSRGLSPAVPPRRRRVTWMVAALAIANVVLAAILVIVASRAAPATITTLRPAGGDALDAQTGELLRRLAAQQRTLEQRLSEVEQMRAVVEQLTDRVRRCEDSRRDRREPEPKPSVASGCDEVSCVLTDYASACCARYPRPPKPLPDFDRDMISTGIAAVRDQARACSKRSSATGIVKVHVRVDPSGHVASVFVAQTPDDALGACVEAVVRKAHFPATAAGGSFSYPFPF
ncbi:MAG TPA: hypothetical protein VLX92_11380 [Kofleriaceae bacterium]|nr:hypothetical protein [Kofleriaceae bacterium]